MAFLDDLATSTTPRENISLAIWRPSMRGDPVSQVSLQAVQGVEVDHGLAGATDERADVRVGLERRQLADEEGVGPEDESVHHLLAVGRPSVVVRRRLGPVDPELIEVQRYQVLFPGSPVLRRQTGAQGIADVD